MKTYAVLFILFAIMTVSEKGHSWGDEGHAVTALVAQNILTLQSQSGDREASQTLSAISKILKQTSMAEASVWPDKIKQISRQCNVPPYVKDPNGQSAICDAYKYTAAWHFINTDGSRYVPNPSNPNYFKGDMVVLINGLTHVLRNEEAPSLRGVTSFTNWKTQCLNKKDHTCKKEALAFLIHLLGDIHQPLHSGAGCDLGGNVQYITFFGQEKDPGAKWCGPNSPPACSNHELHQAWDANLLLVGASKPVNVAAYVSKLIPFMSKNVTSSDPNKCVSVPPNAPVNVDGMNGPVSWSNESLCYIPQVYTFPDDSSSMSTSAGPANRCRQDKKVEENGSVAFSAFAVGPKYYKSNIVTINERLYWGGFRLATLLKTIYGNGDKVDELH